MKTKYKTIILLIASLFLINCSHIPTNAVLPLPPELIVPTISVQEVECLSDKTFLKIMKRDKLKSARIETLKAVIRTTHQ